MPMMLDSTPSSSTTSLLEKPTQDRFEERRRLHHEADIVIVGAGVVGCAAAVTFGRQGRSVILLEKSLKEPDRIVGELLQPGGVEALEQLGLGDCLEDIDAIPCLGYEILYHNEPVSIPYPKNEKGERPQGRSFHHGKFIQKLRAAAMTTPNVTVIESTVTDVVKNAYTGQILGVECLTKEKQDYVSEQYFGSLTLVADGYASKIRKEYIHNAPEIRSKFYGLELIDAELPSPNHGHVILSDGPPTLIYQIGTHETRILCDIPEKLPSASVAAGGVKGHLRNVVLPSLPACVRPSFEIALENGKFRSMPNSFLHPSTQKTPGLLILGDAMNMRHPLTGGGMTVAFKDIVLMRSLLSPSAVPKLEDTGAVLKQLRAFHWKRKNGSSVINILAMALYSLFAADDKNLKVLQRGCFRYFQRGGACVDEPVSLLAGIIVAPAVLLYHFFAVALYGIWVSISEAPVAMKPLAALSGFPVIWTAICVIGPYLISEIKW